MRIASLVSFIALAGTTLAGQYKKNLAVDGPNPSHVGFNLYEPSVVKPNAPVVVGLHWCGGSADAANSGYGLNKWADQYGFVVIYPDTPHSSRCWDVNTAASLKHEAGGDSLGIVSMVKQVIKKYNADAGRVFTAGFSSGAMMTQVLLGAYPDVFTAGAANSGVPFACCASNEAGGSCAGCGAGNHDGKGWGDIVRNAYPGYSGWRPHVQLIHGSGDSLLNYNLLDAEIKQWTNVLGISSTPVTTEQNTPKIRWTKTVYGKGEVVAYGVEWAGHSSFAFDEDVIEKFFDLACPAGDASCFRRGGSSPTNPPSPQPTPSSSQPTPTTSKPAPTPAPTSSSPGAAMWGQCGGNNWNGPTTCAQGRCVKLNDWYYQCQ